VSNHQLRRNQQEKNTIGFDRNIQLETWIRHVGGKQR
jgi:hypothetical protein